MYKAWYYIQYAWLFARHILDVLFRGLVEAVRLLTVFTFALWRFLYKLAMFLKALAVVAAVGLSFYITYLFLFGWK